MRIYGYTKLWLIKVHLHRFEFTGVEKSIKLCISKRKVRLDIRFCTSKFQSDILYAFLQHCRKFYTNFCSIHTAF